MKYIGSNSFKGFTLIELLVVVLIIAILAAVALPQYTKAVDKARLSEMLVMNKAIYDAQQRYFLQNDEYASSADQLDISIPADYTVCHTPSNGTYYSNGKNQIIVSKNTWGMGYITNAGTCNTVTRKGLAIITYLPGSTACPDTRTAPCIVCFQDGNLGKTACETFGGTVGHSSETGSKYININ
ncbi:prepilin-type N-terminal cleavage/methylation domain-containing protein [Parelusimicrobium proximum]|uniref:type IV pilin protein n=1 Tax=Parelusimicrobium proximum TaxID=3228953 RepID=UPI003D17F1C9